MTMTHQHHHDHPDRLDLRREERTADTGTSRLSLERRRRNGRRWSVAALVAAARKSR